MSPKQTPSGSSNPTSQELFELRTRVGNILGSLELAASSRYEADRNRNFKVALQETRELAKQLRGDEEGRDNAPLAATESGRAEVPQESAQNGSAERSPRPRILLAEDNAINQRIVTALLKRDGYEITQVTNGKDALELATTEKFDLVLMDIQMPVMDGLDAASFIRAHYRNEGKTEKLPILALTACESDELPFIHEVMDDYIQKPFDTSTFLEQVRRAILRSQHTNLDDRDSNDITATSSPRG